MAFLHSHYLVESDWLESNLQNPDLRILDCSVSLKPNEEGEIVNQARQSWAQNHIPGSGFVDLARELSDPNGAFPFTFPSANQFSEVMSRLGVCEGKRVILYDACRDQWAHIWATRVWWMLRAYGFENAAILNGGWHKWNLENRPSSTNPDTYPSAQFLARLKPELFVSQKEVLENIGNPKTCLINALTAEEHAGKKSRYGRPGHIPSSLNIPTVDLIDPITHAYLPADQLQKKFEAAGILDRERIITYCGGGIAATSDAFILTLLGKKKVAVYDGSLLEWSADENLPMEIE